MENKLFSQKLKQFLKLLFIYLSQNIYHHFIIWIYLIDIIHFLGGSYFDRLCYQLNYVGFKYIIQNFHSLKKRLLYLLFFLS